MENDLVGQVAENLNLEGQVDESTELTDEVENKTLTLEEHKQLLQSETDKRVAEALKTSKSKWVKEAEEQQKEALRLATLSEEDKWKEELSNRERLVAEKELRIKQLELSEYATNKLSEFKLPNSAVQFVISEDEESTLAKIQLFKDEFDKALTARLDEKLVTRTPSKSSSSSDVEMSKEIYEALSLADKNKFYLENPEQARKLIYG